MLHAPCLLSQCAHLDLLALLTLQAVLVHRRQGYGILLLWLQAVNGELGFIGAANFLVYQKRV